MMVPPLADPKIGPPGSRGSGGRATDTRLYVQESGRPGSPAVVFLHGAGASGRMWREHTARLAGRFHCLAPDLPGFGRSNQLASASVIESADLVAELIQRRVPPRRAHLVGLSWGGGVAHALLARHPELVDRAVIDDAGVLVLSWWGGRLIPLGVTLVSPFLHTPPVTALFSGIVGMDEVGRADLRASSRRAFRRAFIEGFKPAPFRIAIDAPCPTLLVAGEKETAIRASNAALAALMPHAVARFAPGLGHGWLARRTGLHVRMVEAWLTGQQLPSELIREAPSPSAVERLLRQIKGEPTHANDPRARAG
jgi:pimeloyl-ACP methyl ester carboxylesterase